MFHTQSHSTKPWFVWPVVLIIAACGVWMLVESLTGALSPFVGWFGFFGLTIAGPALVASLRLGYTVTDRELRIDFRPIWRKSIPLELIERAEATTYRPMAEYLGWGIRWSPVHGWAFTLSGNTGVRLTVTGSRKPIVLGDPDPQSLADAINRATA